MSRINGAGFVDAGTERGDERDLVMFRTGGASDSARYQDYATVAAACYVVARTKLQLFTGAKPARVLLNDREVALSYDPAEATISLTAPAGQHQLKIELR